MQSSGTRGGSGYIFICHRSRFGHVTEISHEVCPHPGGWQRWKTRVYGTQQQTGAERESIQLAGIRLFSPTLLIVILFIGRWDFYIFISLHPSDGIKTSVRRPSQVTAGKLTEWTSLVVSASDVATQEQSHDAPNVIRCLSYLLSLIPKSLNTLFNHSSCHKHNGNH